MRRVNREGVERERVRCKGPTVSASRTLLGRRLSASRTGELSMPPERLGYSGDLHSMLKRRLNMAQKLWSAEA